MQLLKYLQVEEMKRQYEDKLAELEDRAKTAKAGGGGVSPGVRAGEGEGAATEAGGDKQMVNEEQKAALEK